MVKTLETKKWICSVDKTRKGQQVTCVSDKGSISVFDDGDIRISGVKCKKINGGNFECR